MVALTRGLLGNGWPFPPGLDPSSGIIVTPTRTDVRLGQQGGWTVAAGRWWMPLQVGLTCQCAGGANPWDAFELVIASAYFGDTNNPGLAHGPLYHVGFAPIAAQQVHLEMGVGLAATVMAPVDPNRLAYAGLGLPNMLLGPQDQISVVFEDGAGGNWADGPRLVAVEFESGYGQDDQQAPAEEPLPTPLLL